MAAESTDTKAEVGLCDMAAQPPDTKTETQLFEMADNLSDVTFIVEDRKLYFYKVILSLCSPVFDAMLSDDFKEKMAAEIPLPGKTYEDMVSFFKQLHPRFSSEPITDETVQAIAQLADEYQVDFVLKKCEQYITSQMDMQTPMTDDQLLLYLSLSERLSLKELRERLVELEANRRLADLQNSSFYNSVPPTAIRDLAVKRLAEWETYEKTRLAPATSRLFDVPTKKEWLRDTLHNCRRDRSSLCFDCFGHKMHQVAISSQEHP